MMEKETMQKAVSIAGKTARIGLGFGLILLDVASSAVGAILYAVTLQD